jgi:hypothetical protein
MGCPRGQGQELLAGARVIANQVGVCDSSGRLLEAFILDVRAERAKQFTGGALHGVVVELAVGGAAERRCSRHEARDPQV